MLINDVAICLLPNPENSFDAPSILAALADNTLVNAFDLPPASNALVIENSPNTFCTPIEVAQADAINAAPSAKSFANH